MTPTAVSLIPLLNVLGGGRRLDKIKQVRRKQNLQFTGLRSKVGQARCIPTCLNLRYWKHLILLDLAKPYLWTKVRSFREKRLEREHFGLRGRSRSPEL
jgi:hypothetical protein